MKKLLFILAATAIIFTQQGCIKSCDVSTGSEILEIYKKGNYLYVRNKAAETVEILSSTAQFYDEYGQTAGIGVGEVKEGDKLIGGAIKKLFCIDNSCTNTYNFSKGLKLNYGISFLRLKCNTADAPYHGKLSVGYTYNF